MQATCGLFHTAEAHSLIFYCQGHSQSHKKESVGAHQKKSRETGTRGCVINRSPSNRVPAFIGIRGAIYWMNILIRVWVVMIIRISKLGLKQNDSSRAIIPRDLEAIRHCKREDNGFLESRYIEPPLPVYQGVIPG
jgi:hypothetical protein